MEEGKSKGQNPRQSVALNIPSYHNKGSTPSDFHSSIDHLDKGRYRPYWFACCARSCLLVFFLIIILIFLGITYLAFLKSGLPKVNVRTFNITKLEVDDGSQKMNAIIGLGLIFSNKNDKLQLLYGPLAVDVTSEDILLGKKKFDGFSQKPLNDTNLDMSMTLDNVDVNKDAAEDLKSDIKANEALFDVYAGGHIGFKVGRLQMNTVPFLAFCHHIKREDVDFGRKPECNVKLFAGRPSTN